MLGRLSIIELNDKAPFNYTVDAKPPAIRQSEFHSLNTTEEIQLEINRIFDKTSLPEQIESATELANSIDFSILESVLPMANSLPISVTKDRFLNVLLSRLATVHPNISLSFIESLPLTDRSQFLPSLFHQWILSDPNSALDILLTLQSTPTQSSLLKKLSSDWAKFDLEGVLLYAKSAISSSVIDSLLSGVMATWVRTDQKGLLFYTKSLEPGIFRDSFIRNLASVFVLHDREGAFSWIKNIPIYREKLLAAKSAVEDLAHENLDSALAFTSVISGKQGRLILQGHIIRTIVKTRPIDAVELANKLPPGKIRDDTFSYVLSTWSTNDFVSCLAWIHNLSNPNDKWNAISAISKYWVKNDLNGAAAYVLQFKNGNRKSRRTLIDAIATEWALIDPKSALEWASKLDRILVRNGVQIDIVEAWASINGLLALNYIMEHHGGDHRLALLNKGISAWVQNDLANAKQWAENLEPSKEKTSILLSMTYGWSEIDPFGAGNYALLLEAGSPRNSLINTLISDMLKVDSHSALDWVNDLTNIKAKQQAIQAIGSYSDRINPEDFAEFALGLDPEAEKENSIFNSFKIWTTKDLQAAQARIETLEDGTEKNSALRGVYYSLTQSDPAQAAEIWSTIDHGNLKDNSLKRLALSWVKQDPENALNWGVDSLEGPELDSYILNATVEWADFNPDSASDYVLTWPDGELKDSAVSSIINLWSNSEPSIVADWIDEFPDNELKKKASNILFTNWSKYDQERASAWLATQK